MLHEKTTGIPRFEYTEYADKQRDYVLLIPVINEGERIQRELRRAADSRVSAVADIVICDGGSTDGSLDPSFLINIGVNSLLVKKGIGKQGTQLRMGIWWALQRGYKGVITIDGNDKDSIEDVPRFVAKLRQGYDFIQGSRFVKGGKAINTPLIRWIAVKLIHAPVISITAKHRFTDTTNGYRGYSARYLTDDGVKPLRDIFITYELLAYLSVRASQLGYKVCEIPVTRAYPPKAKIPTKISFFKGSCNLIKILFLNMLGKYNP